MKRRDFKKFFCYTRKLQRLAVAKEPRHRPEKWLADCAAALDGQPGRELRERIAVGVQRRAGAFFTGSGLAERLLKDVNFLEQRRLLIVDPTCGVGDLLLAAARRLPLGRSLNETLASWSRVLSGLERQSEFVCAAKARLLLLARKRHGFKTGTRSKVRYFAGIQQGDALRDVAVLRHATHVVLNPPFVPTSAPRGCTWAKGHVNSAAVFLERTLQHVSPGTKILAILPEVLRSGSRYDHWRCRIGKMARIIQLEPWDIFDSCADVHVFLATMEKRQKTVTKGKCRWMDARKRPTTSVSDFFVVSVGPVVPYRDPKKGPRRRYVNPRNVPAWKEVRRIKERRRFEGRIFRPPFVVVRRTSRPEDAHRATASIVFGKSPVTVENHLLVCEPLDGTLKSCEKLLDYLKRQEVNTFLNHRIRCRHLTVGALREVPFGEAQP